MVMFVYIVEDKSSSTKLSTNLYDIRIKLIVLRIFSKRILIVLPSSMRKKLLYAENLCFKLYKLWMCDLNFLNESQIVVIDIFEKWNLLELVKILLKKYKFFTSLDLKNHVLNVQIQ